MLPSWQITSPTRLLFSRLQRAGILCEHYYGLGISLRLPMLQKRRRSNITVLCFNSMHGCFQFQVALAYMRANVYGGQNQPQPPELDEYLRTRFADLVAGSEEPEGKPESGASNENEQRPRLFNVSTSQTWHHVLDRQSENPGSHLNDDGSGINGGSGGGPSLMGFSSSAHSSSATLTSGLEPHQPSTSVSSTSETPHESSPYDTYIDEYRPYGGQGRPGVHHNDHVPRNFSMFRPVVGEASKHSSMRSYETIQSEHMMPPRKPRQRDGYQDVSL